MLLSIETINTTHYNNKRKYVVTYIREFFIFHNVLGFITTLKCYINDVVTEILKQFFFASCKRAINDTYTTKGHCPFPTSYVRQHTTSP